MKDKKTLNFRRCCNQDINVVISWRTSNILFQNSHLYQFCIWVKVKKTILQLLLHLCNWSCRFWYLIANAWYKVVAIRADFHFIKCIFCLLPIYHLIPLKSSNINMITLPYWTCTSSLVNHCYGRLGFPLLCIECYLWCSWNANGHLLLVYDENISC